MKASLAKGQRTRGGGWHGKLFTSTVCSSPDSHKWRSGLFGGPRGELSRSLPHQERSIPVTRQTVWLRVVNSPGFVPAPQQWSVLDGGESSYLGGGGWPTLPLPARTGLIREQRGSSFTRNESVAGPKAPEDSKRAREKPGIQASLLWLQIRGKGKALLYHDERFQNRRFHRLGACRSSAQSPSQHFAWVHEASGVQCGLELSHGLYAHGSHFLLQQSSLAQPNAVFPSAGPVECQCPPGRKRKRFSAGCSPTRFGSSPLLPGHGCVLAGPAGRQRPQSCRAPPCLLGPPAGCNGSCHRPRVQRRILGAQRTEP